MGKYILLIFALLYQGLLFGQVKLKGKITSLGGQGKEQSQGTSEPVVFAPIRLISLQDSNRRYQALSDFEGGYLIEDILPGKYRLSIQAIGYHSFQKDLRIAMPPAGNQLVRDWVLSPDSSRQLGSVIVTGKKRNHSIDHQAITFSPEQIKAATHGLDLVSHMAQLKFDVVNNKLSLMRGGALQILINGVKATQSQLLSIPPNKIKQVNYYDLPPARYAGAEAVIDVLTYELETGITAGADLRHAPTTGFANDVAYLTINHGKHRIEVNYGLEYRNYSERVSEIEYQYLIGNNSVTNTLYRKDAFGYTNHQIELLYSYQFTPKEVLQVSFLPKLIYYWNSSEGSNTYTDPLQSSHTKQTDKDKKRTLSPVLDVYYQRPLWGGELSANLRGTGHNVKADYNQYYDTPHPVDPISRDEMTLRNDKYSLIGELNYTHKTSKIGELTVGYRGLYTWLHSDITNLFGPVSYSSRYRDSYLYGAVSGNRGSWMYRLSMGLSYLSNQSYSNSYNRLIWRPEVLLGYRINSRQSLRFVYKATPVLPGLSQLSNNATRISTHLIKQGNPDLVSGISHSAGLLYNLNSKYLSLNAVVFGDYTLRPIIEQFAPRTGGYLLGYTNGKRSTTLGGRLQGTLRPFGTSRWEAKYSLTPQTDYIQGQEGDYRVNSLENNFELCYNGEHLQISYQFNFPTYELSDGFVNLPENNHHLLATYKLKRWKFFAGILFLGAPSHYHTKSLPHSVVKSSTETNIYDNKNMLLFGLSYHFSSGKTDAIERKLHNSDNAAPSF